MRVGDLDSVLVETHFKDLVGDITLHFSANVHDVQTEDCGEKINFAGTRNLGQTHGSMGHEGR